MAVEPITGTPTQMLRADARCEYGGKCDRSEEMVSERWTRRTAVVSLTSDPVGRATSMKRQADTERCDVGFTVGEQAVLMA
jgi:hypothetical protein